MAWPGPSAALRYRAFVTGDTIADDHSPRGQVPAALMSNIDAVNALITAINFDRFAEIEARHNPDVTFSSFRGPTVTSSVGVEDWQRTFLRDYADCNYA